MATRFRALESCRGICAVAVMLFHLDAQTHFYAWPVVRNSWVAVDFFFTLSGFVIASAYGAKLQSMLDLGRFAIRRLGRLYPLHLAALAAYVAVEEFRLKFSHAGDAFTGNTGVRPLVENLLLVQGFTANHESWNYPAWTVSAELWINLAFGLFAVMLRSRFVTCALLLIAILAAFVGSGSPWIPVGLEQSSALLDAGGGALEFLLGYIAFQVFTAARIRGWEPPKYSDAIVVLCAVLAFGYADLIPALGIALIFLIVVFVLSFESGPLSTMLRWRPLTALGVHSYSIYLTHSLYLLGLEAAVSIAARHLGRPAVEKINGQDLLTLGGPWAMDGAAAVCVVIALLGSSLTYRFVEEPARAWFNWLSGAPPPPKAHTAEVSQPVYGGAG